MKSLPLWLQKVQDSSTGQHEGNEEDAEKAQDLAHLRGFLASESQMDRDRHKDILFGLLSGLGEDKLKELAKKSGVESLNKFYNEKTSQEYAATSISFLPQTLHAISGPATLSAELHSEKNDRRQYFISKKLEELETETRAWHIEYRPQCSAALVKSFSLQFNECSVAAISRWCNSSSRLAGTPPRRKKDFHPTVDSKFRICSICRCWGHYEIECPQQQPEDTLRFAHEIEGSRNYENEAMEMGIRDKKKVSSAENQPTKDVIVEDCEGVLIEQRKELVKGPQLDSTWRRRDRQVEEIKPFEETNLDGFVIKEGRAASSFVPSGAREQLALAKDDIVAWFESDDNTEHKKRTAYAGVVLEFDPDGNKALVHCLQNIAPRVSASALLKNQNMKVVGSSRWIAAEMLYLVEEPEGGPFLFGSRKRPQKRKYKGWKSKSTAGLSHSQRYKRAKKTNVDGTLEPKTKPRKQNGTFARPRGRKPIGLEWDEARGVWVLPKTSRESKTT